MFNLLVVLSLITSNSYGVFGITLNASVLTELGYSSESPYIAINGNGLNISHIDPNAFNGYTKLTGLSIIYSSIVNLDLEVFKDSVNLNTLDMSYNSQMTQLTNSKKIKLPLLDRFFLSGCPLVNLDSNVINAMPNLTYINYNSLNPIKPNQLSPWKKLRFLTVEIKDQTSLTKSHFTGLNSLNELSFTGSNIKTIEVHTLLALPNVTYVRLSNNEIRSFEYLQIPTSLYYLDLGENRMNYFRLSRTMGFLKILSLNNNQFRSFKSMDFTFLTNLTYLDLSNNPHAYPNEISSHIKPLVNLDRIVLENLSISSIDSNFFKFNTKLQNIFLSNNKISAVAFNAFINLKIINYMKIDNNQINFLDNRTFVGLNNLESLTLKNNRLTKIARGTFYNLNSLKYLDLQDNNITELDDSTFSGCDKLGEIYLNGNPIASTDNLQRFCPTTAVNCKVYF